MLHPQLTATLTFTEDVCFISTLIRLNSFYGLLNCEIEGLD